MQHNWLLYIAAFASAFAITLVATPFAKWISIKCGAIDYPKDRGVHKKPMPRMGGVAIVLGFTVTVLMVFFFDKGMSTKQFIGFLSGALLIAALGVLDDMKNLPAKLKFCVQIVAALIVIFSGIQINVVLWPVTAALQKFSIPITLVWIVGVTNAVNLIDGLDGLAAGVSSIAALSLMVLCIMTGSNTAVVLTAALAGACLGFLPRNFNPAEIFMGDTGSTFLGFVLSVTSILGVFKGYALLAVSVSVLCLGLPVFDTIFAMLRRMAKHQSIMQPDRGHLHHRLIDRGFSQKQAVLILYAISFCLGCLAIFISFKDSRIIVVVLLTVILLSFIIYYFNVHIKHKSK
ncbi:glycosyltransferase family 4 protein [Anaerotignum propionicum]|jgi:UDP-GlcNAc:undecaprenyl-phosphate GlcNAc-1-phosphate transferase|uniref:UDP-GlcNAc:undecaprenyl-phosphate GlcNAc-1-phosphate transferase n=1 Tax=Anaerotignum propionicum DSM 1682 TaxID=991789 RepID=A0A0X8VC41_ANAPI|nr:MraY family glycosyltransferase [Anaerotignum propionicum]AMJ42254.1 putative undecaprenyl-phosphate N-acetylglucosaminyl 1-phosphate transferase [Anaerotignum propionicum DSM 1682]MEA5056828.1 MraY family glycosyltransferase [Anaerotignum propionicum]SHE54902.1 UDP-GlcNAc:undecaprenyl-phosphate GlcNAc-1-phosphate transferase [[Clostridium] propionicum DSM 1682] [Anaerotignum propionicum DSM 1682]HBF65862.1 undecaprenyl/decaprenyl-phosphate alpha-N-acetylglucosaminyl 1-phosphate transferase 